jgi:3-methylfumaryl-CoA hydratase
VPAGQKTTATVPTQARTDHAWSERTELTNALNFRFSAMTWNAHRIHYDGDYTRSEEGYPALVSNGGLSMHLMVDAALAHAKGTLTGYTTRLVHPLWVGDSLEVRGEEQKDGKLRIWAADKNGVLCGEMDLEFAR